MFIGGAFPTYETIDFDYSDYLGPDYESQMKPVAKVSTIVCNHSSWLDIMLMLSSKYCPGFAAKKTLRKVPIFGILC
jgi:1-acyl-sn-glycerol-3-phosphate acyltransferase